MLGFIALWKVALPWRLPAALLPLRYCALESLPVKSISVRKVSPTPAPPIIAASAICAIYLREGALLELGGLPDGPYTLREPPFVDGVCGFSGGYSFLGDGSSFCAWLKAVSIFIWWTFLFS